MMASVYHLLMLNMQRVHPVILFRLQAGKQQHLHGRMENIFGVEQR